MVVEGTFEYRSHCGRELMTPGSLLLGNAGDGFECTHEHATGDRCVSFSYVPDALEQILWGAGARAPRPTFRAGRIPPVRDLSPYSAGISTTLAEPQSTRWEELAIDLAVEAFRLDSGVAPVLDRVRPAAIGRVTQIVRGMEGSFDAAQSVDSMARQAGLSPYHFLRTFQGITGVTPHQYLLRMRLRRAAVRIASERAKILDIALDCGFGDVSNFNRAFRAEFGVSPRIYRRSAGPLD
jgi:AraC-like DNA-binding protein